MKLPFTARVEVRELAKAAKALEAVGVNINHLTRSKLIAASVTAMAKLAQQNGLIEEEELNSKEAAVFLESHGIGIKTNDNIKEKFDSEWEKEKKEQKGPLPELSEEDKKELEEEVLPGIMD